MTEPVGSPPRGQPAELHATERVPSFLGRLPEGLPPPPPRPLPTYATEPPLSFQQYLGASAAPPYDQMAGRSVSQTTVGVTANEIFAAELRRRSRATTAANTLTTTYATRSQAGAYGRMMGALHRRTAAELLIEEEDSDDDVDLQVERKLAEKARKAAEKRAKKSESTSGTDADNANQQQKPQPLFDLDMDVHDIPPEKKARLRHRAIVKYSILALITAIASIIGVILLIYFPDGTSSNHFHAWRLCFYIAALPIIWVLGDIFVQLIVFFVEKSMFTMKNALYFTYACRRPACYLLRSLLALGLWPIMMTVLNDGVETDAAIKAYNIILRILGSLAIFCAANLGKVLLAKILSLKFNKESHLAKMYAALVKERWLHQLLVPRRDIFLPTTGTNEDEDGNGGGNGGNDDGVGSGERKGQDGGAQYSNGTMKPFAQMFYRMTSKKAEYHNGVDINKQGVENEEQGNKPVSAASTATATATADPIPEVWIGPRRSGSGAMGGSPSLLTRRRLSARKLSSKLLFWKQQGPGGGGGGGDVETSLPSILEEDNVYSHSNGGSSERTNKDFSSSADSASPVGTTNGEYKITIDNSPRKQTSSLPAPRPITTTGNLQQQQRVLNPNPSLGATTATAYQLPPSRLPSGLMSPRYTYNTMYTSTGAPGSSAVSRSTLGGGGGGDTNAALVPSFSEPLPRDEVMTRLAKLERYIRKTELEVTFRDALDKTEHTAIDSDTEAKRVGLFLFYNVKSTYDGEMYYISPQDLELFLPEGDVMPAFEMLDQDGDGMVSAEDCVNAVDAIFHERKNLAASLKDTRNIAGVLETTLGVVFFVAAAFFSLNLLFHMSFGQIWGLLSAILIGLSFIFGHYLCQLFENLMFLFNSHPFDIGDVLFVNGENMTVEEIQLSHTVLLNSSRQRLWVSNQSLITTPFINVTTSPPRNETIRVLVDLSTPAAALDIVATAMEALRHEMPQEISGFAVNFKEASVPMKMVLSIAFDYTHNGSNIARANKTRTRVYIGVAQALAKAGVDYTWPVARPQFGPSDASAGGGGGGGGNYSVQQQKQQPGTMDAPMMGTVAGAVLDPAMRDNVPVPMPMTGM